MAERVPAGLTAAAGRKFAFTVGGAFLVFAAISWWRHHPNAFRILGGLGATMCVLGIVMPAQLGPLERAWMGLAHLISKVTTPIFMGVVYFAVITPISVLMAAFGKRPMRVARSATYWVERAPDARRGDLTRQF